MATYGSSQEMYGCSRHCVGEIANGLSSGLILGTTLVFVQISKGSHLVYPQFGFRRPSEGRENEHWGLTCILFYGELCNNRRQAKPKSFK